MRILKPFLDVLGLISASLLVRSRYRKMPILASPNAKKKSLRIAVLNWFGVLNY
eukprot:COSAG06_NODE_1903_length_8098_cov_13.582286_4_plen_54_part_00